MDFQAAMETFAEAWVAANTPTVVNNESHEPETTKSSPSSEDLPPAMVKQSQIHLGKGMALTGSGNLLLPINMPGGAGAGISGPDGVKSMPIHCVVEQMTAPPGAGSPHQDLLHTTGNRQSSGTPSHSNKTSNNSNVELDTYAILPGTTLFSDLVRTALIKIGYTASEALGAKGAIQIKNWKPLTFDTITENPNCTLDDILGDLTSIATLRIRLCSQSRLATMEEVKEKLLQFLLERSHGMLTSSGCPIEKNLLSQISRGDYSHVLSDVCREAFNKWYKEQSRKNNLPPPMPSGGHLSPGISRLSSTPSPLPSLPLGGSTSLTPSSCPPFVTACQAGAPLDSFPFRTRARTSFDVDTEIPRLQNWFSVNQHPSREEMVAYLKELNSLESRRGKKPLDLTNIIYWFKNARAAVRRNHKGSPGSGEDNGASEPGEESMDEGTGSAEPIPMLPNRNAIYVVNPLHHDRPDKVLVVKPDDDEDDYLDEEEDELMESNNSVRRNGPSKMSSGIQEISETNNNCVNLQHEATDLSMPKKEMTARDFWMKQEDRDQDYHSGSSGSPTPSNHSLMGMPPSTQGLNIQSPHTALQMAAMTHALNMHYMHPSLYQAPTTPYNNDMSSHSPTGSESLSDRKKRSRVFIDPLSEIPKLEMWFEDDTHPSSHMIEKYTNELNSSAYRQRFPKLEAKNVQLWFKNHRAKVKRQRLGQEVDMKPDSMSPADYKQIMSRSSYPGSMTSPAFADAIPSLKRHRALMEEAEESHILKQQRLESLDAMSNRSASPAYPEVVSSASS